MYRDYELIANQKYMSRIIWNGDVYGNTNSCLRKCQIISGVVDDVNFTYLIH